jgi:sugar/nucleoside kinase (ribokinase family)
MRYDAMVIPSVCLEESIEFPNDERTKVTARVTQTVGGTSLQIAFGLTSLFGWQVKLIGTVGDGNEPTRDFVSQGIQNLGLDAMIIPCREGTSVGHVLLPEGGPYRILSCKPPYKRLPIDEVRQQLEICQPRFRIASGVVPQEAELIQALFSQPNGSQRVLNPRRELVAASDLINPLLFETDILYLNHEELSVLIGREMAENEVAFEHLQPIHERGPKIVVVTCNEHGAVLSAANGQCYHQPIIDCGPVEDKTGAGDSFLTAFLYALDERRSFEECLIWGIAMSGFKVCRIGGINLPSRQEVETIVRAHFPAGTG